MKTKTLYVCENCGTEFRSEEECEKHEDSCIDKIKLYNDQLSGMINSIKSKYGTIINNIDFNVVNNSFYAENHYVSNYDATIHFTLSNGNKGTIVIKPCCNQDESIKLIEKEIDNKVPMEYNGIIHIDTIEGWYTPKIGETDFLDIAQRLNGRKIKLEVIE